MREIGEMIVIKSVGPVGISRVREISDVSDGAGDLAKLLFNDGGSNTIVDEN